MGLLERRQAFEKSQMEKTALNAAINNTEEGRLTQNLDGSTTIKITEGVTTIVTQNDVDFLVSGIVEKYTDAKNPEKMSAGHQGPLPERITQQPTR